MLGPPKTAFASSRTISRLTGAGESATGADGLAGEDTDGARTRSFADRQQNRKSLNTGEKDGRVNRDSWTAARDRRALAEQDSVKTDGSERNGRVNRRDRDQDGERRNGEKHESRWGHRDEKGQNSDRAGGWRERESNRRERGPDRGDTAEKEPEWFDEPAVSKKQDDFVGMTMAHTQEDFQKWKDMMNARTKGQSEEKQDPTPVIEAPAAEKEAPITQPASLKLDGVVDKPFGAFAGLKSPGQSLESGQTLPKSMPGKGKSSRFASMFKKDDPILSPPIDEPRLPNLTNEQANGSSEDKEGFLRILQMLGGANLDQPGQQSSSEPASPPSKIPGSGSRQRSRFFDATPRNAENVQSPQQGQGFPPPQQSAGTGFIQARGPMQHESGHPYPFGAPDGARGPSEPSPISSNTMPAEAILHNNPRDQMTHSTRPNEYAINAPPSRETATPDVNIQNLLAAQRSQRQQAPSKDSEFLLGLLQGQSSRPPSQQARPERGFTLWLDQPPEPHAPKPRGPPPTGLVDDQLFRRTHSEMSRQDQQHPPPAPNTPGDALSSQLSQRAPPGFDEQALFLQQQQAHQRRNFTEQQRTPPEAYRRMSGHPMGVPGLQHQGAMPAQQMPPLQPQGAMPPLQFGQSGGPQAPPDFAFMQAGPPPGFPPNMRHPQGFANIPNIFQAPQPQGQSGQRELPPGFGGAMLPPQHIHAGPPPGFGQGMLAPTPNGQMPPGLMGVRPGVNDMGGVGLGRGRFDGGFEQRR